jgi:OOP family OmpA-OmpF porin
MSKKTLIFLGFIGLSIIFFLCIWLHSHSIEKDIAQCSQGILNKNNLSHLTIDTKDRGRDVLVAGTVESKQLKEKVLNILKGQCHMTGLKSQIKVIKAKPTKKAHIQILFNDNNELVSYTGTTAKETVESNFGFLLDSFKRAKKFNLSINSNQDIIPVDYNLYISTLVPYFSQIDAANIILDGQTIILKGQVSSEQVKNSISDVLQNTLEGQATIINSLSINERDKAGKQQTLDADHCQKNLSQLLRESKVHFNSGSAKILVDSFDLLDHLAQTTKSCQRVSIEIIGHTDKSGNESNNIKLSKARAIAVANYLFAKGVKGEKLTGKGVGSSHPIATNATQQGRMHNRRIEFKVHSLEE